mgnify:CR=1 FL=1
MSADWVLTAAHIIKRVNQGELSQNWLPGHKVKSQVRAAVPGPQRGREALGCAELSGEECVM